MAKSISIVITESKQYTSTKTTLLNVKGSIATTGESYRGSDTPCSVVITQRGNKILEDSFKKSAPSNSTTTLFEYNLNVNHDSSGSSGVIAVSVSYGSDENPVWCTGSASKTLNPFYTITYDANGGTGAPASQAYAYAKSGSTPLSSTRPTRKGYDFLGWNLTADATEPRYYPNTAWALSNGANYKLYAVWKANEYNLNIHSNGGAFADGSEAKTVVLKYNSTTGSNIASMIPIRNGYELLGFYTEDETLVYDTTGACVSSEYWINSTYVHTGNLDVYAKWKAVEDQDIYIYPDGRVYAREFIVQEGLTDIYIDSHGDIYASSFVQSDEFFVGRGVLYAKEFIEGKPS